MSGQAAKILFDREGVRDSEVAFNCHDCGGECNPACKDHSDGV